ncbi:MAG: oligosaccharide flippase family protein [Clostridiales bacterium]|nr:oligosaccharide flippase family protein [Clostridiales bacterium]
MNLLVKNSLYKLLLNLFNLGIPLIIGPYALRVLGSKTMGNIYHVESIFNYFFILSSFGLYQHGIRELSIVKGNKDTLKDRFTSLTIISILASIFTLLVYIVFIYTNYVNTNNYTLFMIYSGNIVANMIYVEWAVEALEDYRFITIKTILVKTIYLICLVMIIKNPQQSSLYALLWVLNCLINNLISYIYIIKKIGFRFKNIAIKKHLKPLLIIVFMANVNTLFTQIDRVMLGTYSAINEVSYYVLPQSIMSSINALLLSFVAVTVPRLNFQFYNSKNDYLNLLHKNIKVIMYIIMPLVVGLFITANKVVVLYGGAEFAKSTATMKIFSIYLLTLIIEYIFTNQIMYVHRKENILMFYILTAGIFNFIANIILIYIGLFNYNTAIFTTLLANIILITLEYIYIRNKLKIELHLHRILDLKILIALLSFIIVNEIIDYFLKNIIISSITVVFICASIYISVLICDKEISKEIKSILKNKK